MHAAAIPLQATSIVARRQRSKAMRLVLYLVLFVLVLWSVESTIIEDTDWERIGTLGAVMRAVLRFAGIDLALIPQLLEPALETFLMACLGTLLGALLSLPVAWLGASNISPFRPILYPFARLLMTLSRSIHEIVWALIFVSAVGLGSFAGILAMGVRSIGFIAKTAAEAIEDIDPKPVEAIKATGGNQLQVLRYAIVPQVVPIVVGNIIFEWDINIRRSAIMGLVGAGGLGLTLHRQMVMYNYPGVTTVLLAIFCLVAIGEVVSYYSRKAVI